LRLLVLADTHVPKRARDLPGQVWRAVDEADVVLHAGDWVDEALVDALEDRATRLIGVYGNNDGPKLRARLPEVAYAELGGLRFSVVHETGPANGRERRAPCCDSPTPTCWSSATAISRGTPRPARACGCSTQALRRIAAASRTAPTSPRPRRTKR